MLWYLHSSPAHWVSPSRRWWHYENRRYLLHVKRRYRNRSKLVPPSQLGKVVDEERLAPLQERIASSWFTSTFNNTTTVPSLWSATWVDLQHATPTSRVSLSYIKIKCYWPEFVLAEKQNEWYSLRFFLQCNKWNWRRTNCVYSLFHCNRGSWHTRASRHRSPHRYLLFEQKISQVRSLLLNYTINLTFNAEHRKKKYSCGGQETDSGKSRYDFAVSKNVTVRLLAIIMVEIPNTHPIICCACEIIL